MQFSQPKKIKKKGKEKWGVANCSMAWENKWIY